MNSESNVPEEGSMLYIIDLGDRIAIHRYKSKPLIEFSDSRGEIVEESVRNISTRWGFPDLVFRPGQLRLNGSSREIGDAVLVADGLALSVQVKSRNAECLTTQRTRKWLTKTIRKGLSQANGTIRTLTRTSVDMTNLRGGKMIIEGGNFIWVSIVLIDLPALPNDFMPTEPSDVPYVVMLHREWEFLFEQLKSVTAVVSYVHRVASLAHVTLGEEISRYHQLALADFRVSPSIIDERFMEGGQLWSNPMLPIAPVGHEDYDALIFLRKVIEDIAVVGTDRSVDTSVLVRVLVSIDSLPAEGRIELGRYLIDGLEEARLTAQSNQPPQWRFRYFRGDNMKPQILIGVYSEFIEKKTTDMFISRVQLAHHDFQMLVGRLTAKTTVGILVTPRNADVVTWDTTMIAVDENLNLSFKDAAAIRSFWQSTMTLASDR